MSEKSISKKNVVNPTLFILWQKKILILCDYSMCSRWTFLMKWVPDWIIIAGSPHLCGFTDVYVAPVACRMLFCALQADAHNIKWCIVIVCFRSCRYRILELHISRDRTTNNSPWWPPAATAIWKQERRVMWGLWECDITSNEMKEYVLNQLLINK